MQMEREAPAPARAEIDTSSPFRSVKEAVVLFGEKFLAGEIANRINEMRATAERNEQNGSRFGSLAAELEETKQSLERAQEERLEMANYLSSLRQELEKTKIELRQIKTRDLEKQALDSETEEIKFVENTTEIKDLEAEKKKYVKFANPPSMARVMSTEEQLLGRQFSIERENLENRNKQNEKKKKKKSMKGAVLPMLVSVFLKKKGCEGEAVMGCRE